MSEARLYRGVVAGVPLDIVEAFMGHEGYLTDAYRRYTEDQLGEFYKRMEPLLLVFTDMKDMEQVRTELEETKENLQRIVNGLTADNIELKNKMKYYESEAFVKKVAMSALASIAGTLPPELRKKFIFGIERLDKSEK